MSGVNDFGIRISRFGFDVKDTADFQTILNSSWPVLKVEYAASVTFTCNGSANTTIYTHNLGYAPVFQVFSLRDQLQYGFVPGGAGYDAMGITGSDSSKIYANWPAGTYTVYLYVYRQDLAASFAAPNIDIVTRVTGGFGTDFGLKVAKIGKDITSTDLRDYVIHSGTQELGVAQVTQTNVSPAGTWTVTHNLGYKPAWLFFEAGGTAGSYEVYNLVRTTADNNQIVFRGAGAALSGVYSAVIFKDPVLAV